MMETAAQLSAALILVAFVMLMIYLPVRFIIKLAGAITRTAKRSFAAIPSRK